MISKSQNFLFLFLSVLPVSLIAIDASPARACNRVCGTQKFNYPFGFSHDCHIPLNCSSNDKIFLGQFPVQHVSQDSIKINVEAKCNRPVRFLQHLFSSNYAPKSTNAILLYNCTAVSACSLTAINVETHFESFNCANNSNISCFQRGTANGLFDDNALVALTRKCQYLLSSLSAEFFQGLGMSLDVQIMELEWWIPGTCKCSKDAKCTPITTPAGPGFRCQCRDKFVGDGYANGTGCRRECKAARYLSGQCRGGIRIAGALAAGAALIVSVGLLCYCMRRRSTLKAKSYTKYSLAEAIDISIPIYPYKEIEKATNGFSDKQRLGTGAYATVYSGKLHGDLWVAIKRIKQRDTDSIERVRNEIKLISSVSHPNLVRLLGCSIENGEQILVYEFMPNGTLCQHLQRERGDGLAWPVRLAIATETAQAIAHLHSNDPPIYHRDIKSSNILLDYNLRSKVADFGLSRLGRTEISHISTAPQGTPGYLDPQYHQHFYLSDKSDVYSFGVLLAEIITSLKVVDFSRPLNEVNLAALATARIGKGRLEEIIDPLIDPHSDAWTLHSVHRVAELAFRCLAFDKDSRPSMKEVAAELEQIRLGRCGSAQEINTTASSEVSPCSSSSGTSSNLCEKPLNLTVKKAELGCSGLLVLKTQASSSENSLEKGKRGSPLSVQDEWLSEQSSLS